MLLPTLGDACTAEVGNQTFSSSQLLLWTDLPPSISWTTFLIWQMEFKNYSKDCCKDQMRQHESVWHKVGATKILADWITQSMIIRKEYKNSDRTKKYSMKSTCLSNPRFTISFLSINCYCFFYIFFQKISVLWLLLTRKNRIHFKTLHSCKKISIIPQEVSCAKNFSLVESLHKHCLISLSTWWSNRHFKTVTLQTC